MADRRFRTGALGSQFKEPKKPTVPERRDEAKDEKKDRPPGPPPGDMIDESIVEQLRLRYSPPIQSGFQTLKDWAYPFLPRSITFTAQPPIGRQSYVRSAGQGLGNQGIQVIRYPDISIQSGLTNQEFDRLVGTRIGHQFAAEQQEFQQQAAPERPTVDLDTDFGIDSSLNRAQLTDAKRQTALAIFGEAFNPNMYIRNYDPENTLSNISQDVANGLEEFIVNPKSERLQDWYQENFGGTFENSDDFWHELGYLQDENGDWVKQPVADPLASWAGYGSYAGSGGGYGGYSGYGGYGGGGYNPYAGTGLINWRIGL